MIGLFVQKRIPILLLILVIAVCYSVISLNMTQDTKQAGNHVLNSSSLTGPQLTPQRNEPFVASKRDDSFNEQSLPGNNANSINIQLPYEFSVIGISDLKSNGKSVPINEVKVLIKFENEIYEHTLNDFLLNTNMQLVEIEAKQISILFEQVLYSKSLTPPNLLSSAFKKQDKTHSEFIQMSPTEIGTRPRIIEHLVSLTGTPYIADGKLVGPGLNPALFKQAGFRVDDVLKTINGKSVTVEAEFEDIKKELKTAHTLKFLVMRKGRLVSLYLDIPSEGLDLVRD